MITLYTKDGTKVGNGIILSMEKSEHCNDTLCYIETDFGNRMKLNYSEVNTLYVLGEMRSVAEWRTAQFELRQQNHIIDEGL